jgi:hypothetical protein
MAVLPVQVMSDIRPVLQTLGGIVAAPRIRPLSRYIGKLEPTGPEKPAQLLFS